MSQSLARNMVHLIFSTKGREPFITPALRPKLHAYLAGIFAACDSPAIAVGGVDDHVHALFVLSKTRALAKVVEEVKKGSSKWAKDNGGPAGFYWQGGYGAFSVSPSSEAEVVRYIARQEERHKRETFQAEFRLFLAKHHVEYDERYVWD